MSNSCVTGINIKKTILFLSMEENYVFLDANVFAYKERNQLVKLLHRIQSKNLKLIMTKKLISEIHNLLASGEIKGRNQNVVLEFIKYATLIEVDQFIKTESKLIPIHPPDDQHIAIAKQKNALIISNDNDMIEITLDQGLNSAKFIDVYTALGKYSGRKKCICTSCRNAGKIKSPIPKIIRRGGKLYRDPRSYTKNS